MSGSKSTKANADKTNLEDIKSELLEEMEPTPEEVTTDSDTEDTSAAGVDLAENADTTVVADVVVPQTVIKKTQAELNAEFWAKRDKLN